MGQKNREKKITVVDGLFGTAGLLWVCVLSCRQSAVGSRQVYSMLNAWNMCKRKRIHRIFDMKKSAWSTQYYTHSEYMMPNEYSKKERHLLTLNDIALQIVRRTTALSRSWCVLSFSGVLLLFLGLRIRLMRILTVLFHMSCNPTITQNYQICTAHTHIPIQTSNH